MASISSLTGNSSTSSLYGNKNIISGLASGMDTESMIENSVAGYKTKINTLLQKQTKLSWKRDAFRSVTDKLVELSQKYTSYTSKTNLASSGFFTGSITTTAEGANASKVSATGKSSSDIQIKRVEQLASAAKYTVSATGLDKTSNGNSASGAAINWSDPVKTSGVSGTLSLAYGSQNIAISFVESDVFENQQEFVDAINKKLAEETISFSGGSTAKASDRIEAKVVDGKIEFVDKKAGTSAANKLYISSASGKLEDLVDKADTTEAKEKRTSIDLSKKFTADSNGNFKLYDDSQSKADYLKDKSISVTLDGVTKNIKIGEITGADANAQMTSLVNNLNDGIKAAFGTEKIKVEATADGGLSFNMTNTAANNTLSGLRVSASATVGEALGIGKSGVSTYLNTGKTLEELGLFDAGNEVAVKGNKGTLTSFTQAKDDSNNPLQDAQNRDLFYDADKNLVRKDGDDLIRVEKDKDGKYQDMMGQKLTINGVDIGTFTKDTKLDDVISAINNNKDAGIKVNYSKISDKFTITATETGAAKSIEIKDQTRDGKDNLAAKLFGTIETDSNGALQVKDRQGADASDNYSEGKDAKFTVTVDGEEKTLTRSTNTVDLDGLSVTLKGTFGYKDDGTIDNSAEAVTFNTKSDTSKITETLKGFVEEVNAALKAMHDAYATQPAEKSTTKHTRYEPLTDEDKEGMSESAIKEYEEKAKQGILFGDNDISNAYQAIRDLFTMGKNGANLRAIGIDASLEDGVTVLSLDEEKLAAALDSDPDKVKNAFVSSSSGNGVMADFKKTLDRYASTSIASPGILVKKAGTTKSSLSLLDNSVQDEMDGLDEQIDKWQSRMSDKIDYYTRQFTALETLMSNMNSQSSMISSMMGGY